MTGHERDLSYRGFQMRREPGYQLWSVTQNGKQVIGLNGNYTNADIATRALDDFLDKKEKNSKGKEHNDKAKKYKAKNGEASTG